MVPFTVRLWDYDYDEALTNYSSDVHQEMTNFIVSTVSSGLVYDENIEYLYRTNKWS